MKNIKMLLFLVALIVTISACNTENPVTSNPETIKPVTTNKNVTNSKTSSITIASSYLKRIMTNGGSSGYDYVAVNIEPRFKYVICSNPGTNECPLIVKTSVTMGYPHNDMVDAMDYAYGQITSGYLTGQVSFQTTGVTVKWSSTSSNLATANSEVKVWETNCDEPD